MAKQKITSLQFINPYTFKATQNTDQTYADGATIKLDTDVFDTNSNFNTGTYTYTAPVAGIYHFSFSSYTTSATSLLIGLYINAVFSIRGSWVSLATSYIVSNGSCEVLLAAGDAVTLVMMAASGTKTIKGGPSATFLSGYLVSL